MGASFLTLGHPKYFLHLYYGLFLEGVGKEEEPGKGTTWETISRVCESTSVL
jgi:hypothetical protein